MQENIIKIAKNKNEEIDEIKESYNEVNYASKPHPLSHPRNLNVIATVLGLEAENIETAKILEIGCSFGGNIIPIAIHYPNSKILGIDLSEKQVELGNKAIEYIGLKNIRIECHDVTKFKTDEKFDYIICHGVYSWVPDMVKDAIMELISTNLSKKGLAYISYNTYPGWKVKEVFKDAMNYHVENKKINNPLLKVDYANSFLEFLGKEFEKNSIWGKISEEHGTSILNKGKYYISHEFLENFNDPCYFYEFMEKAHKHNLGFVSEARFSGARFGLDDIGISNEAKKAISFESEDNQEKIEQYLDFIVGTQFRTTILSHEKNTEKLLKHSIEIEAEDILKNHITGKLYLTEESDFWTDGNAEYYINELSDFVFEKLNSAFPNTIQIKEIFEEVKKAFPDKGLRSKFITLIFKLIRYDSVKISSNPVNNISFEDEKPKISEKIRKLQDFIYNNPNTVFLTNIWHDGVSFGDNYIANKIFKMLDGNHDKKNIYNELVKQVKDGKIILYKEVDSEIIELRDEKEMEEIKDAIPKVIEHAKDSFLLQS